MAVCAAVPAVVVFAAPASAELRQLDLVNGVLMIQAGESADALRVEAKGKAVEISDQDPITSKPNVCEGGYPETSSFVTCPRKQVKKVVVDLGDGNDSFDGDGDIRFEVNGDKGDDVVDGGDAADLLEGKLGDDTLEGSEGSDDLLGGLDDDKLIGKGGRDLLAGGPGTDSGNGGPAKDKCVGVEKAKKGACS